MTITSHEKLYEAYKRAIQLGSEHDEAIAVVAVSLDLNEEDVRAIVVARNAEVSAA